ncbi:hypothetical protein KKF61_08135 [Patescibacteria group bacterium]|nr:hypothetical protein [Patescibacteria group bacterium]
MFGYAIYTGKVTRQFAPMTVATTKEIAEAKFSAWLAGTWSLDHPEELTLVVAQLLEGDRISVPVPSAELVYRIKTGVYTERQSEGYETTITQTAYDKFDDWLDGQWDADLPDADERDVYRDRPFDGIV